MEFEIKITVTNEFPHGDLTQDLVALSDYVSECLKDKSYGESVVKYFCGFELFRFDGGFAPFFSNDVEKLLHSVKWLVINVRFDWNYFYKLNRTERIEYFKRELICSIDRFGLMKRKPKSFDYLTFKKDIEFFLNNYTL